MKKILKELREYEGCTVMAMALVCLIMYAIVLIDRVVVNKRVRELDSYTRKVQDNQVKIWQALERNNAQQARLIKLWDERPRPLLPEVRR